MKNKKLSKQAIALLRKVKAHILEEPKRLGMAIWRYYGEEYKWNNPHNLYCSRPAPDCRTVACIAGQVVLLHGNKKYFGNEQNGAQKILKLNDKQVEELCFSVNGKHIRLNRFNNGSLKGAKEVAQHIENFIKKYK